MTSPNTTLEDYQKKVFNSVEDQYIFETEMSGVLAQRSEKLDALKAGIHLHFFRYGLFPESARDENDNQFVFYDQNGEKTTHPEEIDLPDATDVDGFFYARTSLTVGYLYIFNDADSNEFLEYYVDEFGYLHPIYWENNKDSDGEYLDVRQYSKQSFITETFDKDTVIWIAYSSVQWSVDYIDLLRNHNDRRTDRMKQVTCSGFEQDEESDDTDILDLTKIITGYSFSEPYQGIWFGEKQKQVYADFNFDLEKDSEAIKEDMYITLHAPIVCALDIYNELLREKYELKALVDAIQTGEEIEEVKKRYANNEFKNTSVDPEYYALFTLANTCYKLVYEDSDTVYKYDGGLPEYELSGTIYLAEHEPSMQYYVPGVSSSAGTSDRLQHGVDRVKVEGILGVAERTELRTKIQSLRNALGNLLKDNYAQMHLDDIVDNCEEHKTTGYGSVLCMISELYDSPLDIERILLLKHEYEVEDEWKSWVHDEWEKIDSFLNENSEPASSEDSGNDDGLKSKTENYTSVSPLTAALSSNESLMGWIWNNKEAVAKKGIGILSQDFTLRTKRIIATRMSNNREVRKIDEVVNFAINEINGRYCGSGINKTETRFQVNKKKVSLYFSEHNLEINLNKPVFTNNKNKLKFYLKDNKDVKFHYTEGKVTSVDIPAYATEGIDLSDAQIRYNKMNKNFAKILNGKSFNSLMSIIAIGNLWATGESIKSPLEDYGESGVSLIGAGCEAIEASSKAYSVVFGKSMTEGTALFRINKGFGRAGDVITAGVSFWDAIKSFNDDDDDAGAAYLGAGIAYSVAAACSWFGGVALLGPVGLVASFIGLGFFILAGQLTDSELQKFFARFLLCDRVNFPKEATESPMSYAHRIIKMKEELIDDDLIEDNKYNLWITNIPNTLIKLYNLVTCTCISCKPKQNTSEYKTVTSARFTGSTSQFASMYSDVEENVYYQFTMRAAFLGFINSMSILDYPIFLYPNGISNSNASAEKEELPSVVKYYNIIPMGNGYQQVIVNFSIPVKIRSKVNSNSQLLFTMRVEESNANSSSFPLSMNDSKLYLGVLLTMSDLTYSKDVEVEEVKIDTIENLQISKTWV